MSKLRVLVAEDSLTVRRRLVEVLSADPDLEVVGEAADGAAATEKCRDLRPDVVTLDMMMPVMTGLAATEYIMAYCPTPILIVSASVNRGELFRTYDALAAGALDVLEKPSGSDVDGVWEARLVSAVKLVSRIKVITHPRGRHGLFSRPAGGLPAAAFAARSAQRELIAMGASTGGPGAVVEVLRALPRDFRLPILLVVHIGAPFGTAFAEWLDAQTAHRVRYALDGERVGALGPGVVMAQPDRHLRIQGGRLLLTDEAERHSCRPSVDVLFESVAREVGPAAIACLLTGMGKDGALGLLAVRRAGGATIGQDEATSVVYGMPREAALIGAVEHMLPLPQIGPALVELVGADAKRGTP